MLIRSQIGTPAAAPAPEPLAHGGDLAAARQMFPNAPEPFIDLSTGINPFPYPVPELSSLLFERLPDRAHVRRLAAVAAQCYGAPSAATSCPRRARKSCCRRSRCRCPGAPPSFAPPTRSIARRFACRTQRHRSLRAPINSGAPTSPSSSTEQPDGRLVERATCWISRTNCGRAADLVSTNRSPTSPHRRKPRRRLWARQHRGAALVRKVLWPRRPAARLCTRGAKPRRPPRRHARSAGRGRSGPVHRRKALADGPGNCKPSRASRTRLRGLMKC